MNNDVSTFSGRAIMSFQPPAGPRTALRFGGYVAFPSARTLQLDGAPVEISSRAFDLLILLLRSRGRIVSKEAIMRHVWPTTTVDESNLRFQMGVLRKALGVNRDIIKTVPGRGYLLVGDVDQQPIDRIAGIAAQAPTPGAWEGEHEICEALCALLRTVARYPAALPFVDSMLVEQIRPAAVERLAHGIAG